MNAQGKIMLGVIGGFVVGALFVGSAFAAPGILGAMHYGSRPGYSMMGGYGWPAGYDRSSLEEMNRFMNDYRDANGTIDIDRMRDDVRSGKVNPPCGSRAGNADRGTWRPDDRPGGYGMMGWRY